MSTVDSICHVILIALMSLYLGLRVGRFRKAERMGSR